MSLCILRLKILHDITFAVDSHRCAGCDCAQGARDVRLAEQPAAEELSCPTLVLIRWLMAAGKNTPVKRACGHADTWFAPPRFGVDQLPLRHRPACLQRVERSGSPPLRVHILVCSYRRLLCGPSNLSLLGRISLLSRCASKQERVEMTSRMLTAPLALPKMPSVWEVDRHPTRPKILASSAVQRRA